MDRRWIVVCSLLLGVLAPAGAVLAASPSAPATAQPICADRPASPAIADATNADDGHPDPSGRIVFGTFLREHDISGQLVSLNLIDPDGSDVRQLLDCEAQRPRFSPDGTQLAFGIAMDDGTLKVATMGVDGSDLRVLPWPGFAETPDWSPDGTWLIASMAPEPCAGDRWEPCVLEQGDMWNLWRMGVDGSDPQLVGRPDTIDWEPRLSPDGTRVVFTRFDPQRDFFMSLVVRDLASGEERTRTDPRQLEHPDWSPDGRWIVYNPTGCPTCEQVERLPADDLDAKPEVLYPNPGGHAGIKPVYSPQGDRIAFGCQGPLCVMDADGNSSTTLFSLPGTELNHFDWGVNP